MALTTTSSITPLLERIHQIEMAAHSDTVGMSNDGFATVADVAEGYSRTAFYAAAVAAPHCNRFRVAACTL